MCRKASGINVISYIIAFAHAPNLCPEGVLIGRNARLSMHFLVTL